MVPRAGRGRRDDRGRHRRQGARRRAPVRGGRLVQGVPERQGAGRSPRAAPLRLRQPRLRGLRLRQLRQEALAGRDGARQARPAHRPEGELGEDLQRAVRAHHELGGQRLHVRRRPVDGRQVPWKDGNRHRGRGGVLRRPPEPARPEEALLLLPAPAPEGHLLRQLGLGPRRRPRHARPLRLPERDRVLRPLAHHAHPRPVHLAGRIHLARHELAPLHGRRLCAGAPPDGLRKRRRHGRVRPLQDHARLRQHA